jgi:hypothetical protein
LGRPEFALGGGHHAVGGGASAGDSLLGEAAVDHAKSAIRLFNHSKTPMEVAPAQAAAPIALDSIPRKSMRRSALRAALMAASANLVYRAPTM